MSSPAKRTQPTRSVSQSPSHRYSPMRSQASRERPDTPSAVRSNYEKNKNTRYDSKYALFVAELAKRTEISTFVQSDLDPSGGHLQAIA